MADRMPEHKLPYRRKSEERDETASFWQRSGCWPGSRGPEMGSRVSEA
jgi:hypothetical protein